MTVAELLADLSTRPVTAKVIAVEPDLLQDVGPIMIESVLAENNDNAVILMCKTTRRRPVDDFLSRMVESLEGGKKRRKSKGVYKAAISESAANAGKYKARIDGQSVGHFDTTDEAKLFLRGFVLGSEMGSANKGLGDTNEAGPLSQP